MSTMPCPWIVSAIPVARACGADTTALLVDTTTGEVDIACDGHVDILDSFVEEFGTEHYGPGVIRANGPLHNTSLAVTL